MSGEAEPGISDAANVRIEFSSSPTIKDLRKVANSAVAQMENSRTGLKGWAYVEDWMTRLDKGMVTDFNEDINTLLTFVSTEHMHIE